jgi:hypothetical protein
MKEKGGDLTMCVECGYETIEPKPKIIGASI